MLKLSPKTKNKFVKCYVLYRMTQVFIKKKKKVFKMKKKNTVFVKQI